MALLMEARLSRDATDGSTTGDVGARELDLGTLFELHAPGLYRTILAYTGGRGDLAEEAVGEAFARATARSKDLRDPVAWLFRVAFNVANDELRRERRRGLPDADPIMQPPEFDDVLAALRRLTSPRPPGERWLAGLLAIVIAFVVVAFVWETFARVGDSAPASGAEPPTVSGPVTLWLSAERVPPGPVDLVAMLVDREGVEATFGVHATVDRWDGSDWVPYGELVMCMDHWHCTARIQSPGEIEGVPDIGLGARPGTPGPIERFTTAGLDAGWYRISQTANEGVVARGIFEVAPGASSPTPLWSVDTPAISISPALLPVEGGEAFLYPLVPPAPDGSLSRGDIQRAVEGLSETARIERSQGSAWLSVTTVDLLRVPGDDLPRTVELPPLDEGAYRLVRDGPAELHVGHFWVDASV